MPSGTVVMDPFGAFYVRTDADKPPGAGDAITNRMNDMLAQLNKNHGWPITNKHIKSGVPITTAKWEVGKNEYDVEWEVEEFEVSMEWYSRTPVHDWD